MNISEAKDKLMLYLSGDAEYNISQVVDILDERNEAFFLKVMRKNAEGERFQCWRVDKKTGACEQRPRWEAEEYWPVTPPKAQACETCMFRPYEFNGVKLDRADTSHCQIYEYPDDKPNDVYFDGAECEFYESEE
jgi:hypothetical protein